MNNKEVKHIMQKNVVSANENKTIASCAKLMRQRKVGSLIIVNNKKKVVGIITEQDLTRKVLAKNILPTKHKVKEIMSKKIHTIEPNYNLMEAMTLMKREDIEHLPIVRNGRLKGILSTNNVIMNVCSDRYFLTPMKRSFVLVLIWVSLVIINRVYTITSPEVKFGFFIIGAVLIPSYFTISIMYTLIRRRMEKC